ncbi:B-cell receptor CD22 [Dromiciops gliroides]|uniref:B-cell receptor CD22 n=1 Tax=Dromiciops gliroides TaxID=33562 RepID=UPI001CC48985|nr:B-cell receptor CD22 [Dromiciops gliroides]
MSLLHLSILVAECLVLGLCYWNVKLPEVLYAWQGTCVQIPCSYNNIRGIRKLDRLILFHNPSFSNANSSFYGTVLFDTNDLSENKRIKFLGHQREENCSMLILQVQVTDSGKLGLRMMAEHDKWMSYVQLNVTESAPQPYIQLPQQLHEFQTVTVTCFVNHFCPEDPVRLLWSLDRQEPLQDQVKNSFSIETQSILMESKFTFSLDWMYHTKELACSLSQTDGQLLSKKTLKLDVKHTPKIMIKASPHLEVKEGESVTLRCLLQSSNPEIQGSFSWFKDETSVQNSGEHLTLSNVTWQQAGNYCCEAYNEMGRGRSEPVQLQVRHSPVSKVLSADFKVMENRTVELTCETVAYPPPTNFTWYHAEKQVLGEVKQKLRFQAVNRMQAGQYTCLAENSEGRGEVSEKAWLDVQYPPTGVSVTIVNQTPIQEGDSVTLSCSYEQSNPTPYSYSWRAQFLQKHRINSQLLTISSIPWNAESVTCWACNDECSQATPLHLDVQYAPRDVKVILLTPKADIQSKDQVHLRCDFSSSHPADVHYSWTQNGKHFCEGRYLNWSSISPEDSGLYSCLVTNSIGETRSQEWDLKIQYPPRHFQVSINPGDTVMEKTNVVLTCEADANPAVDLYTWFDWKGQKIGDFGPRLILWSVTTHQSGAYWCHGTNKLGTGKSDSALLTVYYSPETIGKRTALGLGVCLAVFFLALLGVRCWKKIRGEQNFQEQPRRQGSFFIRNKKVRRPQSTAAPQYLGYYNPAMEERINYATLQFPARAPYLETTPVTLQTEDQSVTYSVLQKPYRGDYENVMPPSLPEDEGLHYSELIQFGEGERLPVQEGVEYVTLKY